MAEVSAETLFEQFRHVPLSEFFRKNKQYLGYVGKVKSLTTVVHELLTNSLDACEEAGILPAINITIEEKGTDHYKVSVKDNGPGIPEKHLEKVFGQLLAGTKFHRNIQLRGQQGLGVSGAVLFSQITTGKSSHIKSGTGKGKVIEADVELDIKNNCPRITNKEIISDSWRGTVVESEFKGVTYQESIQGPFEYIRRTAAANPHAQIFFKNPEGQEILFERVVEKVPRQPQEIKPHPEGLEAHDLLDLAHESKGRQISTFLKTDLARISSAKIDEVKKVIDKRRIAKYLQEAGFSEDDAKKKSEAITPKEWDQNHPQKPLFDMKKTPKRMEWKEAEALVLAFKEVDFMAPPTAGLIPIGEKTIEKALDSLLAPDFFDAITRSPTTFKGGIPFLVETAVAYGGNAGRAVTNEEGRRVELMRFANRAPLLFDQGSCVLSRAIHSIDWKRYHIQDIENAPVTVFINIVSTHVPYTSTGKQAVAGEEEILEETRLALMQIARKLQSFLSGRRRAAEAEAKKKMFERYIPETASALSKLTGEDAQKLEASLKEIVKDKFGDMLEGVEEESEEEQAAYEEELPEGE